MSDKTVRPEKTVKDRLISIQRFLIAISLMAVGFFLLVFGVLFLLNTEVGNALSCFGAGTAALFASSIDRFELLKVFGIEAKTRDLDRLISEAQVTLDQLGEVAKTVCKPLASLYCGRNGWNSDPTLAEKSKSAVEIKASLGRVGCSEGEIRMVLNPWIHGAAVDGLSYVQEFWSKNINESLAQLNGQIGSGTQSDEANSRMNALTEFRQKSHVVASNLSVLEICDYLEQVPARTPLADELQRQALERLSKRAAAEIRHLNQHLEYGDAKFWDTVSQHYGRS